ncbi:MAG: mechanosensitive ion channel family protein [Solirubrobacterales bacterium]
MVPFAAASPETLRAVCGEDPGWACRSVLDETGDRDLANLAEFAVDKPLAIALIVVLAWIVSRVLRRFVKRLVRRLSGEGRTGIGSMRRRAAVLMDTGEQPGLRAGQRVEALASVLQSVASFTVWTVAAFMILGELGIELGPLLAGAGILGVALGFGSQSLVKDFLSGMFILIEDQYGVGDVVDLDAEVTGTVEAITLRTTRLRALDGTVWYMPNGEFRRVGNKSQHWSRALLDVEVAYDTDIDHARSVIEREAAAIKANDDAVLEDPEIWGVENLGANGVVIRVVLKTQPSEQWRISRLLRERLKGAFEQEGIEIPFPQQMVWHRAPGSAAGHGDDAGAVPREP